MFGEEFELVLLEFEGEGLDEGFFALGGEFEGHDGDAGGLELFDNGIAETGGIDDGRGVKGSADGGDAVDGAFPRLAAEAIEVDLLACVA